MDWKKIALTTVWVWSGVKSAQMCRPLCLSKLSAWMCLHPDDPLGHSHTYWCSLLPRWDFTPSQFVLRILAATILRLLYVLHLSRATHIPAQPHILNYLSSSGTHTHTYSEAPHRTPDCSNTVLYSYERASAVPIPLSISLIWMQNS